MVNKSGKAKGVWATIALLLIALIARADYATGYEVSLFTLYCVPVALVGWQLGRASGIVFACLATAAMRMMDALSHHPYSAGWIPWEVIANRWFLFMFIAVSFDRFRRTRERDRSRLRDLQAVVPMCSVCHRVKNENGEWVDFEAQVSRRKAEHERRLCGECAKVKYVSELAL